ncbi:MAG TPA: HAD family hydrolase [Candidatus Ligilactobacillus excrementavium]|nr:HAD family hydrolase [Candidatus Ligilactobacillus excrementavium]
MQKKLILFDVDGTLVNSYPYYEKIMQQTLPKFGKTATQAELSRAFTMTAKQEVAYFKIPNDQLDDWFLTYDDVAENVGISPQTYPQVDEMFETLLAEPEVKLGIVTSRTKQDAKENLHSFWWYHKMSLIVTSSDTQLPKPSGQPLLFALDRLGYQPQETIYIGDADTDQRSAIEASVDFGGALWGTGAKEHFDSQALLLETPADVIKLAK